MRRVVIVLFFLSILFSPLILEAGSLSFRAEPSKVRLIIFPSNSQSGTVKVYSQSDENIKIRVYLEDWAYAKIQDGSKDFFPAKSTSLSCADWITFNPAEFVVSAYGEQNINYIARVPADAKGGHYAVMFFETGFVTEPEQGETVEYEERKVGAYLNIRLGVLFYVEAKDAVKRDVELTNFSVSKDKESKGLLVTSDIKNVGNADITSAGSFHIMDKDGLIYARSEFNDTYTFPGDTAKISATWKEPLPKGKYSLVLTLDLGKALEELNLGRGPIVVKEAEIEIGQNTEVMRVGELK